MPPSKPALRAAGLVEREQRRHVGVSDWAAVGAPRQSREDLPGTGGLGGAGGVGGGAARENPAPARRIARSGCLERAADGHGLEARHAVRIHRVERREVRLQQIRRKRVRLLDEGDADRARARLDRHPHLHPRLDDLDGVVGAHQRGLVVLGRADGDQVHALAVDADLDLVRRGQAADEADVGAPQLRLDRVLAVEGKRVANQRAAAGAERQAVDVTGLRQVEPDAVGLVGRPGSPDRRLPRR